MSEPRLSMTAEVPDDLPRTLRRAREEQLRVLEAREKAARGLAPADGGYGADEPSPPPPAYSQGYPADPQRVVVTRFDVPMSHLALFLLKVVVAAIPAMVLMGVMIWGAMHVLKTAFPQLIETRILIDFPDTVTRKR